jgi:GTP-binding protein HflX
MNKTDLLPEMQRKALASTESVVYISAARNVGLEQLREAIDARLTIDALRHLRIRVPQSEGKLLAQIEARAHVAKRVYRDSTVQMEVDAPESLARALEAYAVKTKTVQGVTEPRRKAK